MVQLLRTKLVARIVVIIAIVMIAASAGSLIMQMAQNESVVEDTVNSYNMRVASSYSAQMQTERYSEFLRNPVEGELYWSLRGELNQFRSQIGALYVYFVMIDENGDPRIMIDGQPEEDELASPIFELTDMPMYAVQAVKAGETASTPILVNPDYGSYLSAFAPVALPDGTLIGALGIDTDAAVFERLAANVMRESVPFYLLMLVVTAGGIAVVYWFVRRSLKPMQTISASAEWMAAGDLARAGEVLRSAPVRSVDEIGSAYRSMLVMSEHLHERVRNLVVHMDQTVDQLVVSSADFESHSNQMLGMSERMDQAVRQIDEGVASQKQSADDSAAAMEQITQGIVRIAESSSTVADAAIRALDIARGGEQAVSSMNGQMNALAQSASSVHAHAVRLKGHTNEIDGVLGAVRDFAEQTKLLALNASIEAARAGEHGRGFTVVANEVRKLADASAEAVHRISSLLDGIADESGKIGVEMDNASREMAEGLKLSRDAESSLRHTLEAFRLVSEQIIDISATTEQLSASSEEVAATVDSIADIAGTVFEQTRQIRDWSGSQLATIRQVGETSAALSESTQEMRKAIRQVNV